MILTNSCLNRPDILVWLFETDSPVQPRFITRRRLSVLKLLVSILQVEQRCGRILRNEGIDSRVRQRRE